MIEADEDVPENLRDNSLPYNL